MLSSKNISAQKIIDFLGLEPLTEEGGFFKQVYRHSGSVSIGPKDAQRSLGTHIYYLITPESFSALHAVKSVEIFHFYAGDPVEMLQISEDSHSEKIELGSNILAGQNLVVTVPENTWQGTRLKNEGAWALLGCTVIPGFEFEDYIHGNRGELIEKFPEHSEYIKRFTI